MKDSIKIAIVDDQNLFREGLSRLLNDIENFAVVISAASGSELFQKLKSQEVDVLLTDIAMPEMNGFEVTELMKKRYPEIKTIALTMHDEDDYIIKLMDSGINGYLLKDSDVSQIKQAIIKITIEGGANYFTDRVSQALLKSRKKNQSVKPSLNAVHFTNKEILVIQLICEELTAAEISERMNISVHTVNGHKERIMNKIKVKNTIGIVNYAYKNNIVSI